MIIEPKKGDQFNKDTTIDHHFSTIPQSFNQNQTFSGNNSVFSEQNHEEEEKKVGFNFVKPEDKLPIDFWLYDWQCSLSSHQDLEPYERRKMGSLPTNFNPFSSGSKENDESNDDGLSSSDSIWLRKCESLNTTPSNYNFFNRNDGSFLQNNPKMIYFPNKANFAFREVDEEKENWGGENKNSPQPELFFWNNMLQQQQQQAKYEPEMENLEIINDKKVALEPLISGFVSNGGGGQNLSPLSGTNLNMMMINNNNNSIKSKFNNNITNWLAQPEEERIKINENNNNNKSFYNINNNLRSETINSKSVSELSESQLSKVPEFITAISRGNREDPFNKENVKSKDEMDILLTFLSKFDHKVAAIWGNGGNKGQEPLNNLNNPWASSLSSHSNDEAGTQQEREKEKALFDFRAMQMQLQIQHEQEQEKLNEALEKQLQKQQQQQHQQQKCDTNRIFIGGSRISPPKGKHTIMHSIKEYFGNAPPESDYFIIRKNDVNSSVKGIENSLAILNHAGELSSFSQFSQSTSDKNNGLNEDDANNITPQQDEYFYQKESEDEEQEIVEACSYPAVVKPNLDVCQDDLLTSWKTHFKTIDACVKKLEIGEESPSSQIQTGNHPLLPEFKTEGINDEEYEVYKKSKEAYFPLRFKARMDTEKAAQTSEEDLNFAASLLTSSEDIHNQIGGFDWEGYMNNNSHPSSHGNFSTSSPFIQDQYEYQHFPSQESISIQNLQRRHHYMQSSWPEYDMGNGQFEYGTEYQYFGEKGGGGGGMVGDPSEYIEEEEEMFGECQSEYDFLVEGVEDNLVGEEGGGLCQPYENSVVCEGSEYDADYGQFQDHFCFPESVSLHDGSCASSNDKSGKGNRKRTRIRPCKYFFLEGFCRRGKENCKFSHDLITCRYWAEGSCLKGQFCPFLHCFVDGNNLPLEKEESELSKRDNKYHLESESDFPALLGSTNENAMLSSRVPMSLGFSSTQRGEEDEEILLDEDEDDDDDEEQMESSSYNLEAFSSLPEEKMLQKNLFHRQENFPPLLGEPFSNKPKLGFENDYFLEKNKHIITTNNNASSTTPITTTIATTNTRSRKGRPTASNLNNESKLLLSGLKSSKFGNNNNGEVISSPNHHKGIGINKNHSSSGNWICSMISVKEKRRKKKH